MINALITLASFVGMEAVAWLTHKYVMHGLLWNLHRDHHKKDTYGFFERNDFFFLIFAIPGIIGLLIGIQHDFNAFFWVGLGITIYGFAYFFVHDIFIHQRFKIIRNVDLLYFRAIRRAHKIHHKHLGKYEGECFGMLWVPMKYFRNQQSKS
ncbi:MAG: beta-carotene hydroxylase [Bacteroidota bacterium]